MAHQATNQYGTGYTQIAGPLATCTNSVETGSGANRVILVTHFRRTDRSPVVNSVTLNGESMTILGVDRQVSGLYYARTFALVNPSFSGVQSLVITTTTNGSNSVGDTVVAVYDGVDPNAVAADLLNISSTQTVTTPWTGAVSVDVTSAVGHQVVGSMFCLSADVAFVINESGTTEQYNAVGGGIGKYSGEADGASTVTCSWTFANLSQDITSALFGFDLPPPSTGLFGVRQYSNGQFEAIEFVESASLVPAMRIGANLQVQIHEMIEVSGRTTHQLSIGGVYRCGEFKETP